MNKTLFAALALVSAIALAGDDQIATFTASGTAACVNVGQKRNVAIQCRGDVYVTISPDGTVTNIPSSTNGVKVPADKLYDTPTTAGAPFVCAIQVSAGGACAVFINRSATQ